MDVFRYDARIRRGQLLVDAIVVLDKHPHMFGLQPALRSDFLSSNIGWILLRAWPWNDGLEQSCLDGSRLFVRDRLCSGRCLAHGCSSKTEVASSPCNGSDDILCASLSIYVDSPTSQPNRPENDDLLQLEFA